MFNCRIASFSLAKNVSNVCISRQHFREDQDPFRHEAHANISDLNCNACVVRVVAVTYSIFWKRQEFAPSTTIMCTTVKKTSDSNSSTTFVTQSTIKTLYADVLTIHYTYVNKNYSWFVPKIFIKFTFCFVRRYRNIRLL